MRLVEPAGAVVSIVTPTVELGEIRQAVCKPTNLCRSAEAAARLQDRHPEGRLLGVADTFELFRRAAPAIWGDELWSG